MSTYQILAGTDQEFEVIEYPTHNQERAFNRLLVESADHLVARAEKERICEKWGWDPDEAITREVETRGQYHLRLAKIIFKDADDLSTSDIGDMRGGLVQEGRMDFIAGCEGRSDEPGGSSTEGLMQLVNSLIAQNGVTTPTESPGSTAGR